MFLYNAKVRLLGSLSNEVSKKDLTASEIALLQRIHGKDAVVNVAKVGEVKKRTDRSERNRLAAIYQNGPSADGKTRLSGESFVDSVLGVGNTLPAEYVAPAELAPMDAEPEEAEEIVRLEEPEALAEPEPAAPIKRTRIPKVATPEDILAA